MSLWRWIAQCYRGQDFLSFLVDTKKEVNLVIPEGVCLGFSILAL